MSDIKNYRLNRSIKEGKHISTNENNKNKSSQSKIKATELKFKNSLKRWSGR